MKTIYYCVNKTTKEVISAGYLPEVWGNITGMADLPAIDVSDLTWAGYPDFAFIPLEVAQEEVYDEADLTEALRLGAEVQTIVVLAERDAALTSTDWVVTRSIESGIPVPEAWVTYRQQLRDITTVAGFPWDITLPVQPL